MINFDLEELKALYIALKKDEDNLSQSGEKALIKIETYLFQRLTIEEVENLSC